MVVGSNPAAPTIFPRGLMFSSLARRVLATARAVAVPVAEAWVDPRRESCRSAWTASDARPRPHAYHDRPTRALPGDECVGHRWDRPGHDHRGSSPRIQPRRRGRERRAECRKAGDGDPRRAAPSRAVRQDLQASESTQSGRAVAVPGAVTAMGQARLAFPARVPVDRRPAAEVAASAAGRHGPRRHAAGAGLPGQQAGPGRCHRHRTGAPTARALPGGQARGPRGRPRQRVPRRDAHRIRP